MADSRLAQLARHRDRSPQDKAAWLQARLRAGEACGRCMGLRVFWPGGAPENADATLQPAPVSCPGCAGLSLLRRTQMAAFCGDEAARAVAAPALEPGQNWSRFDDLPFATWIRYPLGSEKLIAVRAAWAAGMACWASEQEFFSSGDEVLDPSYGDPQEAMEATKDWLECPCGEHARLAQQAMHWSQERGPTDNETGWWNNPAAMCHIVRPDALTRAGELALEQAANYLGEATVRAAICRELVAWALG